MASRKSKKIWIWIGSVVLLFIVVLGVGAARLVRTANIDPNRIAKVQRGDVARSVVATGKIQPITKVEVKSTASGFVEKLYVDINQKVTKAQPLAWISRRFLRRWRRRRPRWLQQRRMWG